MGIIVADLEVAAEKYRAMGFAPGEVERVDDQNIAAVAMRAGESWIELISPLDHDSPLGRFLDSRGEGMHHVAYLVEDVDATLTTLAESGVELIDTTSRIGLHSWRVAFIHPRSAAGVLTELVQRDSTMTGDNH